MEAGEEVLLAKQLLTGLMANNRKKKHNSFDINDYNKIVIFLNIMFYCMWLFDLNIWKAFRESLLSMFFFIEEWFIPQKYTERLTKTLSKMGEFRSEYRCNKNGYETGWTDRNFTFICLGYYFLLILPFFIIIFITTPKSFYPISICILAIITFILSIKLDNILLNQNRYILFFKYFHKQSNEWHYKWKCRGIAFIAMGWFLFFAVPILTLWALTHLM